MSFVRRHAVPLAAGLAAAVTAFAVVAATSGGGGPAGDGGGGRPAPDAPASPAQGTGLEVFTRMGCGGCHQLAAAGSTGPIGPDLDARLPDHTRESLTAAILTPPSGG